MATLFDYIYITQNNVQETDPIKSAYALLAKTPPVIERKPPEVALPEQAQPAQPQIVTSLKPEMQRLNIDWGKIASVFADRRATPTFYKIALGFLSEILTNAARYEGYVQGRIAQALQERMLEQKEREMAMNTELARQKLGLGYEQLGLQREELKRRDRALDVEERLAKLRETLGEAQIKAWEHASRQKDVTPLINYWKSLDESITRLVEGYNSAPDTNTKASYLQQIAELNKERKVIGQYILNSFGLAIPPEPSQQLKLQSQQTENLLQLPKIPNIFDEYPYRTLDEEE